MAFFFRNGFHVRVKGLHKPKLFLFLEVVLVGCIPGSKPSESDRTTLYDKRSNILWYTEDKRFHNLLCSGSLAPKWQQILIFGEKTNTDQIVFTFRQNFCQIFNFNNIGFLYTRFTYDTCYPCLKEIIPSKLIESKDIYTGIKTGFLSVSTTVPMFFLSTLNLNLLLQWIKDKYKDLSHFFQRR